MSIARFLGIASDKDARDAANLDRHLRGLRVPLSMPEPIRHGPSVTRRVMVEVEVDVEIEVERDVHDGYTGPRGRVDLTAGRVWLADAKAAVLALEAAAYEAAQDEDLA